MLGLWYNIHMKANKKAVAIEQFLSPMFGRDRTATIAVGGCTTCDSQRNYKSSFREKESLEEYLISGMCQPCQDDFFGDNEVYA